MSTTTPTAEKPNPLLVFAAVKQAHLYAMAAVASDEKQDYPTALANYRQVISILRSEIQHAPLEDQPAFQDRILVYSRRMELIELMNPSLKKDDEVREEFKEEVIPPDPSLEDAPEPQYQRPYWMMRSFLKTMTTGAFLTPRVYVHKGIWFQPGVKLDACHVKMGSCYLIIEALQRLSHFQLEDVPSIVQELELFCQKLSVIQNTLAQSLSYIPKAPVDDKLLKQQVKKLVEKGATAMTPTDKHDDALSYAQALMSLFKEAQFLEGWHRHFAQSKSSQQVVLMLIAVGEFFSNVLCVIVTRDLSVLVDRYMRKCLSQLTRGAL